MTELAAKRKMRNMFFNAFRMLDDEVDKLEAKQMKENEKKAKNKEKVKNKPAVKKATNMDKQVSRLLAEKALEKARLNEKTKKALGKARLNEKTKLRVEIPLCTHLDKVLRLP